MDENQIYFQKADEIGDLVYKIYNLSNRNDLIFVYKMQEEKIYSYTHKDYFDNLNERSKGFLKKQYKEAQETNKIVLFIEDELRKKVKSFNI